MNKTETYLNKVLTDNNRLIVGFVKNNLSNSDKIHLRKAGFEIDDLVQEVRIAIWKLLVNKYDNTIAPESVFISCYLPLTLKNVCNQMINSLAFTGKKRRRTQQGKLMQNSQSMDDLSISDIRYKTIADSEGNYGVIYNRHDNIKYASTSDTEIMDNVNYKLIMRNVEKRLNSQQVIIARFLVDNDLNIADVYNDSQIMQETSLKLSIPRQTFYRHICVILSNIRQLLSDDSINWSKI